MANYRLQLTFNWSELPASPGYGPLHQKLFKQDKEGHWISVSTKSKSHTFQHDDTACLEVLRTGDDGTAKEVTFVFDHTADCPTEASGSSSTGDNPFENHQGKNLKGNKQTWSLSPQSGTDGPPWVVAGNDAKVILASKVGKTGETWNFAIYLEVSGPEGVKMVPRTFCFDPELVVGPWDE